MKQVMRLETGEKQESLKICLKALFIRIYHRKVCQPPDLSKLKKFLKNRDLEIWIY